MPADTDLLHIWNPTAVTTSQNFYFPIFDSIDVSKTTGVGCGVSVRGFWGSIGEIFGRNIGRDVLVFPAFEYPSGIPDSYESSPTIGNVTGIDFGGWVVNNQIGIGATPRIGNLRGTVSSLAAPLGFGCLNASGSEHVVGGIAYTGHGAAVAVTIPAAAPAQTSLHEIFMQGCGDIDAAQYGFIIETLEYATITGHRLNVEPPGFAGIGPKWPLRAYLFGKSSHDGRIIDVTVNAYVTIRPGVTSGNVGTLFDFNNDPNISNMVLNVSMRDQVGFWSGLSVATRYANIHASAGVTINENGVQVYP